VQRSPSDHRSRVGLSNQQPRLDNLPKPANRTLAEPLASGFDYSGLGIKIRQRSWRTVVRGFQHLGSMENMSTPTSTRRTQTSRLYGKSGDGLDARPDALAQVAMGPRGSEIYMPELDAALTAGEVAFSIPIRQKVIRAAIFLS
jgi:hypothetical protein